MGHYEIPCLKVAQAASPTMRGLPFICKSGVNMVEKRMFVFI